jgi:hypothetical protein
MSLLRLLLLKTKYSKILKIFFFSMTRFLYDLPNVQNNSDPHSQIYQMCITTPWIYQMYGLFNFLLHYSNIYLAEY